MAKGIGIVALFVAFLAITIPIPLTPLVIWLGLILAVIAGILGDRIFATATPLITAVNILLLSPLTLAYLHTPQNTAHYNATVALLIAPFVAMLIHAIVKATSRQSHVKQEH